MALTRAQHRARWTTIARAVGKRIETNATLGNSPEAHRIRADDVSRLRAAQDLVCRYS